MAKQSTFVPSLSVDCFVAALLAMTTFSKLRRMPRNHPIMTRQRRQASAQDEQRHGAGHFGVSISPDLTADIDGLA